MYTITFNKNKEGSNVSIRSITIDRNDLEMMEFSLDISLLNLYHFYLQNPCESLTIINNTYANKKEIISILKSRWLINKTNLNEDMAEIKLDCINEIVSVLSKKLDEETTNTLDRMIITHDIILYEYARCELEEYLKEKRKNYPKERIKE